MCMTLKQLIIAALTASAGFAVGSLNAQPEIVEDAGRGTLDECILDYDPSLVAITNDHQSAICPQPYLERWRIVTDLNNDGKDDLILSDTKDTFGNAGGGWLVYINSNGCWRCIGDVGLYPGAFTFDRVHNEVGLWYYVRSSAQEGHVGYYSFHSGGMRKDVNQIFVRTAGEDENVFGCMDKAIFGYAHRHPYRFDTSETSTNGIVSWKTIRDWRKPSRKDEIYELEQKLAESEKRVKAVEAELKQTLLRLCQFEERSRQICGVKLGAAWDGGEKSRRCEEVFSGFTNLTVSVDANNYVEAIRLSRNDACEEDSSQAIRGEFEPTDEEQKIILPAVKAANDEDILAFGPYSPDGFFGLGHYSRFDATLAMYHDQGLAPFKALAFEDGVNFTAGLPIVRTSPDHGTAYEMAGRDEADPRSMKSAIYAAIDIYRSREEYDALQAGKMIEKPSTEEKPRNGKPQIA